MGTGLEKFKLTEKIRLSYLRHRGNVLEVAEELDIPLEYVKKIGNKMKKRCSREVAYLVSTTLMEHLLLGHAQRVQCLIECLDGLREKEETMQSMCCEMPVSVQVRRRWKKIFTCLKCGKECAVKKVLNTSVYDLKYRTIGMLKDEDAALVDFAGKMGYTDKKPDEVTKVTQNVVVMGDKSDENMQVVKDIAGMSPMERQKIRKSIERKLLEEEHK